MLVDDFRVFTHKVLNTFKKYVDNYNQNPEAINKQIKDYMVGKEKQKEKEEPGKRIIVKDTVSYFEFDSFGEDVRIGFVVSNFVFGIILRTDEYKEIEKKISKILPKKFDVKTPFLEYPVNKPAEHFISNYLNKLLRKSLLHKDLFTAELVDEYITVFFKELRKEPLEYITYNHIVGLNLDIDNVKLNENITLKKGTHEDYIELEIFDYFHKKYTIHKPGVLLKLEKATVNLNELRRLEDVTFRILRLFNLSFVFPYEHYLYQKSAIYPGQFQYTKYAVGKQLFEFYKIDKESQCILISFFNELLQPINDIMDEEDYRGLLIALERYEWALLDYVRIDRKLMFAVMGLETLFSTEAEKTGQSRRLSFRIPKFLGYLGYRVESAKNLISEAYRFRNKVVHGLEYNHGWVKKVESLLPKVLNYLRVAIIFYLMDLSFSKNQFVKLIDDSFLFKKHEQTLSKMVRERRTKFPLVFKAKIPKPFKQQLPKFIIGRKPEEPKKDEPKNKSEKS